MGYREQAARHRDPRYARAFAIIDRKRKSPAVAIPLAVVSPAAVVTTDSDIDALRRRYREAIGKKPYWGWDAMQLKAKIEQAG